MSRKRAPIVFNVLVAGALIAAPACSREGSKVVPGARFPDNQGIVTEIDFESVQLDGKDTYQISQEVESISTYTKQSVALLSWKNKYVHVGLEDDTVIWIAGIGVVDTTKRPPTVYYANGLLKEVDDDRRLIFADGTVLQLAKGVGAPTLNKRITVEIDANRDVVTRITLVAG